MIFFALDGQIQKSLDNSSHRNHIVPLRNSNPTA